MDFALDQLDTVSKADVGVKMPFKTLSGETVINAKNEESGLILLGSDGEKYREESRRVNRARVERAAARKSDAPLTNDELDVIETDGIDMIGALTVGWFGILDRKGDEIKFTKEGARELLRKYPVIREQADSFIATRTNFTKA
jgi:hypothetical protein